MRTAAACLIAFALSPTALLAADAPQPNDYGPLPTIGGVSAESRIEPRFSAIATNLAGRNVEVRCWSDQDWARLDQEWTAFSGKGVSTTTGYVRRSAPGRIQLAPRICSALVDFTYRKLRPTNLNPAARFRVARALLVLTHEPQHSRGISQEAEAECRGVQFVRPVARMLGATKEYAAFIAVAAWKYAYGQSGAAYRSAQCKNGGALDLNPAAPQWP